MNRDETYNSICWGRTTQLATRQKKIGSLHAPDLIGSSVRFYFGCPVEPFSEPVPASDDVGGERVSGAGLAG